MNFLKLVALLASPFWILDLALRAFQKTPPLWVADAMVIALILIGSWMIVKFLRRQKPVVEAPGAIGTPPARTAYPDSSAPFQGGDWEKTLPVLFHEIRNYSSTLRGNTQLLRRHPLSSSMLEPLGRLERTSAKIECLAKDILEASSLVHLTCTRSIGIPELIEGCILDHFSEERGSFDLQIASGIPPVEADFLKLDRVFLNLFRNAREAGANHILVRVTASSERLCIFVEDDGEGCSGEQIGKLFRPLYTTRKSTGGTGLGLYMVKAILDSHGGSIRAESKIDSNGKGSGMVFTLELPLTQSLSPYTVKREPFRIPMAEDSI